MNSRKLPSLALVLLLLCSLTVAPAAAYDKKIADGAHFIEISGKPLKLDREYYQIASDETVVIDGNRYYWVQIGKDRAKALSSNDFAEMICNGVFLVVSAASSVTAGALLGSGELASGGLATPVVIVCGTGIVIAESALIMFGEVKICPAVAQWFSDNNVKGKALDSDGCILLKIKKDDDRAIKSLFNVLDIYNCVHYNGKTGEKSFYTSNK